MSNGWVKLHRQIFEHKMWLIKPFSKGQAWIDLFANANHTDNSFFVRGIEVRIKRGQIGFSELTMVDRWGWSKNKVRRFLQWLESEHQIEQQKSPITSIITILNYDKYQMDEKTEHQAKQQKDTKRYTNKNDKNVKNDKEVGVAVATTPSVEAIDFFSQGGKYTELRTLLVAKIPEAVVDRELSKFCLYWTEPNKSGTKVRWQLQQTFDVKRRLRTWLENIKTKPSKGKQIV